MIRRAADSFRCVLDIKVILLVDLALSDLQHFLFISQVSVEVLQCDGVTVDGGLLLFAEFRMSAELLSSSLG